MSSDQSRDGEAGFAALLGPHLEPLEAAAREREVAREAAAKAAARPWRQLDEGELMALIFANLDHDNPRVCEGIDFERLIVVERAPVEEAPVSEPELEDTPSPTPAVDDEASRAPSPTLEAEGWVGASWSDDLGPRVELVDRPVLDDAEQALLRRAAQIRRLSELDLHELDRREALRHLEFFVELCRASGQRFCRVITGKGVSSSGAPVLKRVVLEWCVAAPPRPSGRDQVSAWAPELDQYGEWGALILRLRTLSPDP